MKTGELEWGLRKEATVEEGGIQLTNEGSGLVLPCRQGHGQVSSAFSSLSFLPRVGAMVHHHCQFGWI